MRSRWVGGQGGGDPLLPPARSAVEGHWGRMQQVTAPDRMRVGPSLSPHLMQSTGQLSTASLMDSSLSALKRGADKGAEARE